MAALDFTFDSNVSGTTARISVKSNSNTTPTITVLGETPQTPAMVGIGTDGKGGIWDSADTIPNAGFNTLATFPGLTENTKYTYTVEHDSVTENGAFRTNPTVDFSLFVIACDNLNGKGEGCWPIIEDYDKNGPLPLHGIIALDDHGYIDTLRINVDDTGVGGTGKWANNSDIIVDATTVYSNVLGAFAYYGLLSTDERAKGYVPHFTGGDSRQYCRHNIAFDYCIGDHDGAKNNPEEQPNTATEIATAKEVFLQTFGHAQDYINSTNSLAFIKTTGPLELIAYDRVTALPVTVTPTPAVYDVDNLTNDSAGPVKPWLGAQQISDIQGALNETSKFKCLLMSAGSYFMMSQADLEAARDGTDGSGSSWTGAAGLASLGSQQPIDGYTKNLAETDSEWAQLVTKNSVGIAAKAAVTNAAVVGLHGDTHYPNNRTIDKPADAGNVALHMKQFSSGATGNNMPNLHPAIVPGYSYDGVTMDWIYSVAMRPKGQAENESTCLRVDVTWSGCLWKMTVSAMHVPDPVGSPLDSVVLKETVLRKNTASCCG